MTQTHGIKLDREAIEIRGMTNAIAEGLAGIAAMVGASATGNLFAGISALSAFFKSLGALSATDRPGRLAFVLVTGALVRTLEATLADSKLVFTPVKSEFRTLQDRLMSQLQSGNIYLTEEVLAAPQSFSCLQSFEVLVLDVLGHLIDSDDRANIGSRLRKNFAAALHQTWSLRADAFQGLQAALQTPFSDALKRDIEKQRYLNRIQTQFSDEKLIGQEEDPVLLSEVFVPLRGYWQRPVKGKGPEALRADDSEAGRARSERILVDFSTEMFRWIDGFANGKTSADDTIRIVSGGPGVGKSSSLKAIASELARAGKCFPVFIPLQRIDGTGDPQDRIGRELKTVEAYALSDNPLGEQLSCYCADGPVVLFLDGLDEIVAAGTEGASLTRDFVRDVRAMLANKNTGQPHPRVIAIVSGRIPAAQEAIRQLGLRERQVLHLLPFLIDEGTRKMFGEAPAEVLERDQRLDWWAGWHARRPDDPEDVPELLVSERFHDVSVEPLLLYFLVLVKAWQPEAGDAGEISRNAVYRRVLKLFHSREIAKEARGIADSFKDYNGEFELILQAMAMAAWRGGSSRIGQLRDVELYLRDWNPDLQARFVTALGQGERAFGASLFFHARMAEGHETFEFLHKSFAEYLVARRFHASVHRLLRRYENRVDSGLSEADLLKNWTWTWGSRNIDEDVLAFVREEIGPSVNASDQSLPVDPIAALFRVGLVQGYPAHELAGEADTFQNVPRTFSAMTDWARNAEEALLIGLNTALQSSPKDRDPVELWNGVDATIGPGNMLARLLRQRDQGLVAFQCLSQLHMVGANFFMADLSGANLSRANLSGATLIRADLSAANLSGSDLSGASLLWADLSAADLIRADLSEAHLIGANLFRADLSAANLSGANLSYNTFVAEVLALGQARHLDKALLPEGWSVTWNEAEEIWDITMPDGPYVDPREREAKS
ncbi:pentapeptide repeat-containing protein [uncultured Hoeflea sp.]|uniref:pentapeptide repeat-containing protein n=1 Tax=uncultured Hoeflea sp. TaxID=538666 RepID=UPI00260739A4|nr:pentapeptide repeat-containing protein [uncultured Hoeflea sp.]